MKVYTRCHRRTSCCGAPCQWLFANRFRQAVLQSPSPRGSRCCRSFPQIDLSILPFARRKTCPCVEHVEALQLGRTSTCPERSSFERRRCLCSERPFSQFSLSVW